MSKWIVGVMILVVIAMFWKGVEVLGPSNTNKDILYEGPKKSVQERWNAAYEWIEKKRKGKTELKALDATSERNGHAMPGMSMASTVA